SSAKPWHFCPRSAPRPKSCSRSSPRPTSWRRPRATALSRCCAPPPKTTPAAPRRSSAARRWPPTPRFAPRPPPPATTPERALLRLDDRHAAGAFVALAVEPQVAALEHREQRLDHLLARALPGRPRGRLDHDFAERAHREARVE